MKISEVLQEYHAMPACDRMDLLCRMLRHCIPYEMHFLGVVLLDGVKSHFRTHISKVETNANRVNYYSTIKDGGLTRETCEKLCCALAVLHADNRPVAEIIFGMLNDSRVLKTCEEASDLTLLQDLRLLYVMAVNHPALSFMQRHHLMRAFLQRLDSLFVEKSKYTFSGSFSTSMERTLTSEVDGDSLPEVGVKDPQPTPGAFIVCCDVHSVYKRQSDKRYVYMVQVEWSDGVTYTVRRTYGDFFSFQTKLLDLFPEEGGQKSKKNRLIPYLPGKNYSKFLKNKDVAERRLPELHRYSRELTGLPERLTQSPHMLEFFKPKPSDKDEYPPMHKVTNLYDLIDSGKVRSRGHSDTQKGSPSHSPAPQHRHNHYSSPLHRIMHQQPSSSNSSTATSTAAAQQPLGAADSSPSSSRTSHTLPPPITSVNMQQKSEELENTPAIARRPTFPFSRQQLQSEKSAFTPVGQGVLSEDDLASTATLTASVMSIPGSAASLMPTTSTLKAVAIPSNSSQPSSTHQSDSSAKQSTLTRSTVMNSSTESNLDVATVLAPSSSEPRMHACVTQVPPKRDVDDNRIMIASMPKDVSYPSGSITWLQAQMEKGVVLDPSCTSSSPVNLSTVSPTPMTSPSTFTSISPVPSTSATHSAYFSPALPSPTHSGGPRGGGTLGGYPHQPPLMVYAPFSPVYLYNNSPLPSPLASPKTSGKLQASGSYVSISTESLLKWLKSLRLHKYHSIFENMTYEEMCQLSVEDLEKRSMTTGAAKKLFKKLEELKSSHFVGFQDMPFPRNMARKPSTCSLPAALLTEQGITPSSSCDGFSPTGSTCSLDKFAPGRGSSGVGGAGGRGGYSSSSSRGHGRHHHSTHGSAGRGGKDKRISYNEQMTSPVPPPNGSMGVAVGGEGGRSGGLAPKSSGLDRSSSPSVRDGILYRQQAKLPGSTPSLRISEKPVDVRKSMPVASMLISPSSSNASELSNDRRGTPTSVTSPTYSSSSWADSMDENRPLSSSGVRPEWAQMTLPNGEPHSHSSFGTGKPPPPSNSILGHPGVSVGMIHMTSDFVGTLHSHPVVPNHTPGSMKRSVSIPEDRSTSKEGVIIPMAVHPSMAHNSVPAAATSNWVPHSQYHSHPPYHHPQQYAYQTSLGGALRGQSPQVLQYSHAQLNHNNSSANGLLRTPSNTPATNNLQVYTPSGVPTLGNSVVGGHHHHARPLVTPPQVLCYNCGKRGHLGSSCPGITIDADNSTSFHKQLERLCQPARRAC